MAALAVAESNAVERAGPQLAAERGRMEFTGARETGRGNQRAKDGPELRFESALRLLLRGVERSALRTLQRRGRRAARCDIGLLGRLGPGQRSGQQQQDEAAYCRGALHDRSPSSQCNCTSSSLNRAAVFAVRHLVHIMALIEPPEVGIGRLELAPGTLVELHHIEALGGAVDLLVLRAHRRTGEENDGQG